MTAREELPSRVHGLLNAPANVAIHGAPGSGKSWMVDRVIERLAGEKVVRMDLSVVRSGAEAFWKMVDMISPARVPDVAAREPYDSWKALSAAIRDCDCHVFLVFDQFDRVLYFDDAEPFLLLVRELVHRPESVRCTALIASRRSLQAIEAKVKGISTLASVCYTEYLGAVCAKDLSALGPGSGGLSDSEVRDCLAWCGGHAALAKYWLATRPDKRPESSAELERAKVMMRVLGHLDECRLIESAAQLVLGPVLQDVIVEAQELELLGVVVARDDARQVALSENEVFRDALRSRTWNMDPWGVLGHTEVRLRSVVESCLSEEYGDQWADVIGKKHKGIERALSEAREKIVRDRRMFHREAPWLSYTYPADLWLIVQSEWAVFSKVFSSRDKAYWRTVMTGLAEYRAPLAHGRPEVLGEAQRAQCRIYAEEVRLAIDKYERDQLGAESTRGAEAGSSQ